MDDQKKYFYYVCTYTLGHKNVVRSVPLKCLKDIERKQHQLKVLLFFAKISIPEQIFRFWKMWNAFCFQLPIINTAQIKCQ